MPIRTIMRGETWSAEIPFGAPAEQTGIGLDMSVTTHARYQRDETGHNVTSAGAELRLGPNLIDRDQRGTNAQAPSWYVFVGADNEALVWNFADRRALSGVALRDQATIGDLQAGVAWTTEAGGQVSFGLIERQVEFKDATGENDVNRRDHFVAFSFTLHH
jgi:hypothetical protein